MSEHSTSTWSFIDSNIWLYALIQGQDAHKEELAKQLIQRVDSIAISAQVLNEVTVNLLKKAAFTELEIRSLITSFYQLYTITPVTPDMLLDASHIRERYHISYWDSLIIASARASNASILYSEDMQHGLIIDTTLMIVNPFA